MTSTPTIVFERAGFPVELAGERDWRRAIERGHLARDTAVTIFRSPGAGQMMSAAQVPELLAVFEAFEPTPTPGPDAESVHEAPSSLPAPLMEDVFAAHAGSWNDAGAPESDWDKDEFPNPIPSPSLEPAKIPGPVKAISWVVGIIVVLGLLGRCGSGSAPANFEDSAANVASIDPASEPTPAPAVPASFEPSFNCQAATLPAERTICATRELAAQDREMARLYSAALEQRFGERRAVLEQEQLRWLEQRNACGSALSPEACLSRLYVDRIGALLNRPMPESLDSNVSEPARTPRGAGDSRGATAPPPVPEVVLCILPDGIEARISFEQCRARSGVMMSD